MVKNFLRILVCPLDWGIGHATRCVPIIRQLQQQNHEVIIAADGKPFDFLKDNFPELKFIRLPGFRVTYPSGNKMILKMVIQTPAILINIIKEHQRLKNIIRKNKVDVVISDNRFGLWSKHAYSVYMTHQVMIKTPASWKWAEPLLYRMHNRFIRHYDECWIPDLPGEMNLSGDLSHKFPVPANATFIGILSRFTDPKDSIKYKIPISPNPPIPQSPNLLVLLSGPEPQRTFFENIILQELNKHRGLHVVILQGLPGGNKEYSPIPGVFVFSHLPDQEIADLISRSSLIICRPGYSTVMDLVTFGRSAVLVPTPGQTEQEYLASYLSSKGLFRGVNQEEFDMGKALDYNFNSNINISNDCFLLEQKIKGLFSNFGLKKFLK